MIRVTVKKGKRAILEIGDDWCRFYPESKKIEPRQFQLRDIAQVERRDGIKQTLVFLRNAGGKVLAVYDLYGTKGGTEALRFFRDCNQQKLTDEAGNLLPQFEIIVTEKEPTEEQKKLEVKYKKEKERRKAVREQWAANPYFYETPEWIRRIRLISRGMLLAGLLSFLHTFTASSYETVAIYGIVWPIIIWIWYLCFHRIMVWNLHVHENYIVPPFILILLLGFAVFFRGIAYNLAPGNLWRAILFGLLLFLLLLLPFLAIWYKEKQWMESWKAPVTFILVYSLVTTMAWNVLFTFEEPGYKNAVVLDKWYSRGGGRHSGISTYFFTVQTGAGEILHSTTAGSIYAQVDPGDMVTLRWETSAFGITYYEVELLNEMR